MAAEAACGNEAIRREQGSTFLPDCRAYELVSPNGVAPLVETTGITEARGEVAGDEASDATEGSYASALAWFSYYPLPSAITGGMQYLSRRTGSGWSTESVTPPMSNGSANLNCDPSAFLSPDLSHTTIRAGLQTDTAATAEGEYCGKPDPALVENAPQGFQNVYLRNNSTGEYQLVNLTPAGSAPNDATFQAASTDFSHIVFSEEAPLTAGAPSGEALYEWVDGSVHLVSVLPGGVAAAGQVVGASSHYQALTLGSGVGGAPNGSAELIHAVSANGARVFFESGGNLYARLNADQEPSALEGQACLDQSAKACTVQLASGGATFLWATEDGSKVFLSDGSEAELTETTKSGSGTNLYEYDLATGTLMDLTPYEGVYVDGFTGLGESGGHTFAYFVAEGALTGANDEGHEPQLGEPNLYLMEEGASSPVFIATLSPEDGSRVYSDWGPFTNEEQYESLSPQVSPNGRYIGFNSVNKPTGYDNTDVATGESDAEIYLYDAASRALACVSCDADGAPPTGPAVIHPTQKQPLYGPDHAQRNVLDSGQVFFNSPDPLVSQAGNGQENVYEYADGQQRLISTGTSKGGSYFVEATPEGNNVFFITTQSLVRGDTDNAPSLYDARVDGGFAEPPSAPQECEGEGCRGGGSPPSSSSTPASATFAGPGDLKTTSSSKPAARPLTRKQKLQRALKQCRRTHAHSKKKRQTCERHARKRYGAVAARVSKRKHGANRSGAQR